MKRLIKNRLACGLLVLLAAVYLSFLAADLFFPGLGRFSVLMKYIGILLCLVAAIFLNRGAWSRRDSALLISALCLTCVADLFLLLLNQPVLGLLVFCAAHLVYILRYRPAAFKPAAVIVALAVAGCFAAESFMDGFPVKYVLSCLYGTLILAVTIFGFTAPLPRINRRLVTAGMTLFLLCDIHVALFNTLAAGHPYYPISAFLMWSFYLPAQALLALSAYCYVEQRTSGLVSTE